jgi:hypothetical protein
MKIITNVTYLSFALFTLACFAHAQQAPDRVSIRVITTFDYPGTGNSTTQAAINPALDRPALRFFSPTGQRAETNLAQTLVFLQYHCMIRNDGVQRVVEEILWQPGEDFLKAEVSCSEL